MSFLSCFKGSSLGYDNRGRITSSYAHNSEFIYNLSYLKNSNVLQQELYGSYRDYFANTEDLVYKFTYDKSNRLLSATNFAGSSNEYKVENTYDKDGNILTLKRYGDAGVMQDDFAYQYYSGTNKLRKISGTTDQYQYDLNGNMITDSLYNNFSISYDHRNLITELYHIDTLTSTRQYSYATRYWYDETGNRVRKLTYRNAQIPPPQINEWNNPGNNWTPLNNEHYVRGFDGKELATYTNNSLTEWYVWASDMVGKIRGNAKYFFFKDHLSSVRAVVDNNFNLVSAVDGACPRVLLAGDMWGDKMQGRIYNGDSTKFGFTGKEEDEESYYDYFGARYYDARLGRFNSPDPITSSSFGWSSFVYCADNPLRIIDPTGEEWYYIYENSESGSWQFFKNTPIKEVWSGKYDNEGKKIMEMKQGYNELLYFEGGLLQWLMENGTIESWKAISGIPVANSSQTDKQNSKNEGPIPGGWWYVDPSESKSISRAEDIVDFIKWIFKDRSYGGWYTPIHSLDGTETYGREGFQIHGGWDYGSIGCIDLATGIRDFSVKFETHNKVMLLHVDYLKSKNR